MPSSRLFHWTVASHWHHEAENCRENAHFGIFLQGSFIAPDGA
jgi:hypothetical protein